MLHFIYVPGLGDMSFQPLPRDLWQHPSISSVSFVAFRPLRPLSYEFRRVALCTRVFTPPMSGRAPVSVHVSLSTYLLLTRICSHQRGLCLDMWHCAFVTLSNPDRQSPCQHNHDPRGAVSKVAGYPAAFRRRTKNGRYQEVGRGGACQHNKY